MTRKWLSEGEQAEIWRLARAGESSKAIGRAIGRSAWAVRHVLADPGAGALGVSKSRVPVDLCLDPRRVTLDGGERENLFPRHGEGVRRLRVVESLLHEFVLSVGRNISTAVTVDHPGHR